MSNVVSISGGSYNPGDPIPDFIKPQSIEDMTDEQMDLLLDAIRTRRLQAHYRFNETKKLKNAAANNRMSMRYDKVMQAYAKELDKFDKYVEKMEKVTNDLRLMRLQMGESMI